jgi:uncharacterized protein YdeI (YjbR/CyaY-like superfamily)
MQEIETFYPKNIAEWRDWLEQHHQSHQSIWVVFYKKSSGEPTITWSEAVDMALCFGWIDSKKCQWMRYNHYSFLAKEKQKVRGRKLTKIKLKN